MVSSAYDRREGDLISYSEHVPGMCCAKVHALRSVTSVEQIHCAHESLFSGAFAPELSSITVVSGRSIQAHMHTPETALSMLQILNKLCRLDQCSSPN